MKLLQSDVIQQFDKVFIVIDVLDECPETNRESFVIEIQRLTPIVNLLVTSRNISGIESYFEKADRINIMAHEAVR